jgi:hypothetical protein
MNAKVSLGFARLPDGALVSKAEFINTQMTGNATYPTPSPSLSSLSSATGDFEVALFAAEGGGKQKTAAKNAARSALLAVMRSLALYVEQKAAGDLAKLLSSGYDAQKQREPAGVLPAPLNVTLKQGTLSGTLNLRAQPVQNAGSYEVQRTTNPAQESAWQDVGALTAARMTLEGLTPGTVYTARIRAVGAKGPGAWAVTVPVMAV